MKTQKFLWVTVALITLAVSLRIGAGYGQAKENLWKVLFDGKTFNGWHISAKTSHSSPRNHQTGGRWVVEKGVIVGSQDTVGNGGIIITAEKFGDFEVVVEMNNDFGPDSGLFLRSTENGKCYQALIDYHKDGSLMGLYGEGMGGDPHVRNFNFGDDPAKIIPAKADFPLPVLVDSWPKFWRHGQWNEFRARIVGNPPTITTWINGVKFLEFKDDKRRLADEGGIALQVHGFGDFTKKYVRYRNIRVREISKSP